MAQTGLSLRQKFLRVILRVTQSHERDKSRLVLGRIFASGLAQGLGVGRDIQNIVNHLKSQAHSLAVIGQGEQRLRLMFAASRAHEHAGQQQSARLESMHFMELLRADGLPDTGQINGLSTGHALPARRTGKHAAQQRLHGRWHRSIVRREQFKSEGLQSVAGQHGAGLSKLNMDRGFAPAQDVVVHAGHVVMDQRVGMNEFNRTGRTQSRLGVAVYCLAGSEHQQGAQSLATIEHRITHGLGQSGHYAARRSHPALERPLNAGQLRVAPLSKVKFV